MTVWYDVPIGMSEIDDTELEARLAEQDEFEPPESFVEGANVTDPGVYDGFEESWPDCWEEAADLLDWDEDYDRVLDDSNPPSTSGSRAAR